MNRGIRTLRAALWIALASFTLVVANSVALAETTKERILREGKIVIGIHNRSPWGFRDDKTGEATGWHPDLLKAAFSELGVKELDIRVTEFGALVPGLLAGRFDAVASGLAITPERCQQVLFGMPDLKVPDAAIVLSGNPGKIHGYAEGDFGDDVLNDGLQCRGQGLATLISVHKVYFAKLRERTESALADEMKARLQVVAYEPHDRGEALERITYLFAAIATADDWLEDDEMEELSCVRFGSRARQC